MTTKGLTVAGTDIDPTKWVEAASSMGTSIAKFTALMSAFAVETEGLHKQLGRLEKALLGEQKGFSGAFKSADTFFKTLGPATIAQSQYNGLLNDLVKLMPLLGPPMAKLMKEQYDVAASFNKATGTGGRYGEILHDVTLETAGLGVGSEQTAAAMGSLFTNFTEFTTESKKSQEFLAETVIELEALGMASENTGPSMQVLRKGLRMSGEEIRETMLGIEAFADEAGLNIKQVATRFREQIPIFAVYGDNAVDTFKRLEAASKSTGLAMQTMLQTVEKFDTFEGATTAVGSLNQMLGGPYLNAVEMVQETDPTERMKMLKQAFEDAGMSVQDMGYYQKKAFVDMLPGISNVTEMTELLEGDFDSLTDTVGATAKTAAQIQAEAFAAMTPEELFSEALEAALSLGNLLPKVEAITATSMENFVGTMGDLAEGASGLFNQLVNLTDEEGAKPTSELIRDDGGQGAIRTKALGEMLAKGAVDGATNALTKAVDAIETAQLVMGKELSEKQIETLSATMNKTLVDAIVAAQKSGGGISTVEAAEIFGRVAVDYLRGELGPQ